MRANHLASTSTGSSSTLYEAIALFANLNSHLLYSTPSL
nr:MAG TPA: hypothetical protein [Bacteriophage sp.]